MLGTKIAKYIHLILFVVFIALFAIVGVIAVYMLLNRPDEAKPMLYAISLLATGYSTVYHLSEYLSLVHYLQTVDVSKPDTEDLQS